MNLTKDGREEENIAHLQSSERETLTPNCRKSRASSSCQELFLPNNIPKHITTLDEKYVLHCLQVIRNCALRAAARDFASKVLISSNDFSNLASYDMSRLAIECPNPQPGAISNSSDDWTIGSVISSQSMMNILNSPLLQQFRPVDFDVNFVKTSLVDDIDEPVYSNFTTSPQKSSEKPSRKNAALGLKRVVSVSSTNSSFSDKSSSSASATSYQAMLQCTWKDGLPHHVFSVDDKKEVYVANLEPSGDKVFDYVYTFQSRKNGKKEHDIQELELENLGTMRVSTSITLCSNNTEVRETRFVLSLLSEEDPTKDQVQNSKTIVRKNNRLTRKVANVFRSNHSYKRRTSSSAILEDTPWEPSGNERSNTVDEDREYATNLELAAIIVKDVCENNRKAGGDIGGWGLKFLKKSGENASLETSSDALPECSRRNGECSTSMDVLIPVGVHSAPRTRGGGPSSLIDRWISGGQCDCGGWDIGCPLKILKIKPSSADSSSRADGSIDLFIQGSKEEEVPMLKMVNIHEGLYYIHFQSTLSSLQSFAVAAAIFHSRNPLLRSKSVQ